MAGCRRGGARPHLAVALAPAAPTVRWLARSAGAGHVADVMVWSSGRVVKGQPLARLSIPVSTPALRLAQLAGVPRFERNGYVLAPATGRPARPGRRPAAPGSRAQTAFIGRLSWGKLMA